MTDTANLEDGFYWVREGSEWMVVKIEDGHRLVHGCGYFWDHIDFDEIDPRPIKREDVK